MSRSVRVILGVVAAVVFLCCVAGLGMTLLGTRLVGKAIITEPTRVAAVSKQIVSYELPPGFQEIFASDLLGFKMLAIGPADPDANLLVIMLMQLPAAMSISEDELREQMEIALSQQTGAANADLKVVGTQAATITEQSVTLTMREGKTPDGRALRQLSGLFSGPNGPVFLFVTGEAATWNQSVVDGFIASIH
jgi:hypothetical protein